MEKVKRKSIIAVFIALIAIITLFSVFCNVPGLNAGKALAQPVGVISTGQRTITQPLEIPATDLHFIVYQMDVVNAYILDWSIKLNVPYTKIHAVPGDWPFSDGKTHSVAVDIEGINVPYGASVNIIATLNLNTWNTVKFKDIQWTYANHDPVSAMPADIGWSVNTNPGSSNGGWLISKYTVMDLTTGKPVAVDLVGHQFLASNAPPSLQDLSISNGVPGNPGNNAVTISGWGVAVVPTLPTWDEINKWEKWDKYSDIPVTLKPGQTLRFPDIIATAVPVATPKPTPTPQGVIAAGRRTITQPLNIPATDLHFIVYQADRSDAWIQGWGIELNTPFTSFHAAPSQWPFNDGRIHSVAIDIEGINVPGGTAVDIAATLNLNTYNTVKFADIKWTYADHEPVSAMPADIGWAVATNKGTSNGGWLISKYTMVDLNGKPVAVDLVGHQFLTTHASPAPMDMTISNGTPTNPGNSAVVITSWGIAVVPTLPSWDELNKWEKWDKYSNTPFYLKPGQTVQFPNILVTPTPVVTAPRPTQTPAVTSPRPTLTPVMTAVRPTPIPVMTPIPVVW